MTTYSRMTMAPAEEHKRSLNEGWQGGSVDGMVDNVDLLMLLQHTPFAGTKKLIRAIVVRVHIQVNLYL